MKISSNTLMMFLDKLGIDKKKKGGRHMNVDKAETEGTTSIFEKQQIKVPLTTQTTGLSLMYNGIYKSDQITKILTKLQLLLDEEQGEFIITINIQEKR